MPSRKEPVEILIVAAEASSALYAERLLEEWARRGQSIRAFGIGSRAMQKLGFEIVGRAEDMAVVGVQEVLAHYWDIRRVFWQLVEMAKARQPKVVLLLDYPDFNLRLAKELKKHGFKIVYYISPQVWAWRKSRIKQIQKNIDEMLVLFPFEKDFYQKNNVNVEFVGHPLLDELTEERVGTLARRETRQRIGVFENDILLGLMPGSRNSELKHHLALMLQVAEKLVDEMPALKLALLVAPTMQTEQMRTALTQHDLPIRLIQDDPIKMISACDVVLCKSGTGSLLVGLLQKPMVIIYRMKAFSAWLARRFVDIKNFGMINLILGRQVVPELFQDEASVERIIDELRPLLTSDHARKEMSQFIADARLKLGESGATQRVANALEKYF